MKRILLATAITALVAAPAFAGGAMNKSQQSQGSQGMGQQNYSASEQNRGAAAQQSGQQHSGQSAMQQDSEQVREMQQALDEKGFDPGAIDGVWGNRRSTALRDFQRQQGLDPTGEINRQTASALGVDADQLSEAPAGSSGSNFDNTGSQASGAQSQ